MSESSPWWLTALGSLLNFEPRSEWLIRRARVVNWDDLVEHAKTAGAAVPVSAPKFREAVDCGLALRGGHLDTGHAFVQDSSHPLEMAWHGLMHRLEGDYSNAMYWFRRTSSNHAYRLSVHDDLCREVATDASLPKSLIQRLTGPAHRGWQMSEWVKLWEELDSRKRSEWQLEAERIAIREWELLFQASIG